LTWFIKRIDNSLFPVMLETIVIDKDGYRPNIGIIVINKENLALWAKRIGQDAWQFPQELGLKPQDIHILGNTKHWLRYKLPSYFQRKHFKPVCIGQKQKWFLLKLISEDTAVCLEKSDEPEFDDWCWVDYWYPIQQVIHFKRQVYRQALQELAAFIK